MRNFGDDVSYPIQAIRVYKYNKNIKYMLLSDCRRQSDFLMFRKGKRHNLCIRIRKTAIELCMRDFL